MSRAEYVLSRWFAVGACAAILVLVQIALGMLAMTLRGYPPPLGQIGVVALEQMLNAFGIAGLLALFSSVLPGIGDALAWIVLNFSGGVLQVIAQFTRSPAALRATEEWRASSIRRSRSTRSSAPAT